MKKKIASGFVALTLLMGASIVPTQVAMAQTQDSGWERYLAELCSRQARSVDEAFIQFFYC